MSRIFPFYSGWSLKLKILIPLISLSFIVFCILFWIFHEYLVASFENEIRKRAETIASIIIYSSDASQDPRQVQRLVTTLNLEPDINLIVTVAGDPPVIFASTRVQWVDQSLSSLPEVPEKKFLRESINSASGYRYEKRTKGSFIYITSFKVLRPDGNAGLIGNGTLLLDLDVSKFMDEMFKAILLMASGLAASTILIAMVTFLIIRRFILKPATDMKNVMLKRMRGVTKERVPVYFHDEIGSIAMSLNEMLDQLEKESVMRGQVESRLRESESKLLELNSNKDKFFSIIAHDLKSPFSAILGFSKLLQEEYDTTTAEQHLMFIRRIVDGLSNVYKLLENLLEWSRIQLGGIEFHPERVDIGLLAYEIIHDIKLNLEKKRIQWKIEIPENITVFTDKNILKTILRNLVFNALKFSPPGKTIRICTIPASETGNVPDGFIGIAVVDYGMGIAESDLGHLFKINSGFRRLGTSNETGTGLGLVLCREFVEIYGGKIWAESEEGNGSTFIFTVPLS